MIEEIRIGFESLKQDNENYSWILKHVCSCGFVSEAEYPSRRDALEAEKYECGNCGNRNFLADSKAPNNKRVALPTFFDNESDYQGLDFKKTNLSLIYNKDNDHIDVIQPNMVRRYIFNWVNQEFKVYRNNKLEYDYSVELPYQEQVPIERRVSNYLAKGFSRKEIIENLDLENKEFYFYLIDILGSKNGWGRGKESLFNVFKKAMRNYEEHNWAQILANAGYKGLSHIATGYNYRIYRDHHGGRNNILKGETKPHKILRVSKKTSKYIRDAGFINSRGHSNLVVLSQDTQKLQTLNSLVDSLDDKTMFYDIAENIEELDYMIRTYNYNSRALLEYLTDDIRMYQGITGMREGLSYLKDFADMSSEMNIPFEKYPNSLKREHDVTSLNHREYMKAKETQEFSEIMKDNDYLLEESDEFSVLLPETSKDLVFEGGRLNHCVGSYVKQVSKGETVIAFLRRTKDIHEPLVTIEVKGHQVKQARGSHNRSLQEDEKDFIKKWAEERQLVF